MAPVLRKAEVKSEAKLRSQNCHLALRQIGEEPVMKKNLAVLFQVCCKPEAKIATKLVL
jgi:hypothetical protein